MYKTLSIKISSNFCRYEKCIPDTSRGIERGSGKGAFEDLYIELLDQVNGLNLVVYFLKMMTTMLPIKHA